ncbi:MAG: hypothetical protein LBE12_02065 [Planctomycetaceae bacterium]|nr:hypothetical protein [Planctomycetaceae bacterium]
MEIVYKSNIEMEKFALIFTFPQSSKEEHFLGSYGNTSQFHHLTTSP